MTELSEHIVCRAPNENDISFIYASWLNSYRNDSYIGMSVRKTIFYREYQTIIDSILGRGKVIVAVKPDETNIIYGYIIYEPKVLHYVFVKEAFRRLGICKELLRAAGSPQTATHKTRSTEFLDTKFTYNPFILYNKELS